MYLFLTLLACPPPVLKPADDSGGPDDSVADDSASGSDSAPCEGDVLEYSAVTRDGGDIETDTFREGSVLKVVGVITNPCGADLEIETGSTCLVRLWSASNGTDTINSEFDCATAETSWTIPAEGTLEEEHIFSPALGLGSWTLTAEFDYGGNSAQAEITVIPDSR